jgi:chromosome partitioning protein
MRFRETKLKRALEPIINGYDYILLDCPPNLGLFTVNALIAAKSVLIPMETKYLSMLGVARLLRSIEAVKQEANPELTVLGIMATRYTHTNHAKEVVERTRTELGKDYRIFKAIINESTRFGEASGKGKTIFEYAPDIDGALSYREIAKEIING